MSLIEAGSLRARLREATQAPHERMHAHEGFGGAASGHIALPAYRDLLARLYGFHRAFDAAFATAPAELAEAIRLPARARSADLLRDLVALGAEEVEALPICMGAPQPRSEAEWLGALYVTEGSTLGGAQIARSLQGLVTGEDGRRFFLAYGERRSEMWRLFLARLETFGANPEAASDVEAAAVRTFEAFENWMRDWRGAAQWARAAD